MDITINNSDILDAEADLIVMKFADGFHGADRAVAHAIGFNGNVEKNRVCFVSAEKLRTPEVVFIGVGPLFDFRYAELQAFGEKIVKISAESRRPIRHVALTIHGPGYGLDAEQAFLSLIAGIISEWRRRQPILEQVTFAERSPERCKQLDRLLRDKRDEFGLLPNALKRSVHVAEAALSRTPSKANVIDFGARAERKPRLFVAMPFSDHYLDEFEIGFCESAKSNDFICERLDLEHYVGDMVLEIKNRIIRSSGVIALLNDLNPNVFLEVGFALAQNKPTILVAKAGTKLPFDVSGQKCVMYNNIHHLRKVLTDMIAALTSQGVLPCNQNQ
jgi:hypothetical protein